MIVKFRAYYNGNLGFAEAERDDIFAVGDSSTALMKNVVVAACVHFSGRLVPGDVLRVLLANETGAGG
ncbi:MAG: hypothetical protein V3W11_03595 [bacterium]